jgi:beta-galactosidase/beta-glucuronidase
LLVPFPIEAPLSGVGMMINSIPEHTYNNSRLWYRKCFTIPKKWKGDRVLLHFGAVDWEAKVYLNGKEFGIHRGGYDSFSFDITNALIQGKENELVVAVWDPTVIGGYPRGKQDDKPEGTFYYTPSTGIWQTVWLEPVSRVSISKLKMIADIDGRMLQLTCSLQGSGSDFRIEAVVMDGKRKVAELSGLPNQPFDIKIPDPKLWWPYDPFLYDLNISIISLQGKVIDKVESYFGMRKVALGKDKDGITRILLNNQFVFQNEVLDQGFWPDGLYTAPTDEALRYDIESIKKLGFNLSRKHVKVEPERWYYWADKLGLLVWQDMPCSGDGIHAVEPDYSTSNIQRREQFGSELQAMIDGLFNHPSIVSWVVFNEGMGLKNPSGYKLDEETSSLMRQMALIAGMDKTRMINAESGAPGGEYQGWNIMDIGTGQIIDTHCYGTTKCIAPTDTRASVIGEYGYQKYLKVSEKYQQLIKYPGISGIIWTQITDVEKERNGLMTYDRSKFTEDPAMVAAKNAGFIKQTD